MKKEASQTNNVDEDFKESAAGTFRATLGNHCSKTSYN
jgi:hypothetical protein